MEIKIGSSYIVAKPVRYAPYIKVHDAYTLVRISGLTYPAVTLRKLQTQAMDVVSLADFNECFILNESETVPIASPNDTFFNVVRTSTNDFVVSSDGGLTWTSPGNEVKVASNKCECGAHSVGVDKHSNYCPMYRRD